VRKSPSKWRQLLRNKERKPEAAPQQASPTDQPSIGAKDSQEQTGKIKRLSEIVGLVQSLLTIAGIIAAGIWFIAQSESSLKANITHSITHRKIHKDWTWVHASIDISSQGVSVFSPAGPYTMFTEALLRVLYKKDALRREARSLRDIAHSTREFLLYTYVELASLPEVHSPCQKEMDVADCPFFP
jgi:hypothetical protein